MSARRVRTLALRSAATFSGLAGVTIALTWMFLAMRSVMAIGGSCAEGGPYEISTPCPHGISTVMLLGIFGGLISVGVYAALGLRAGPQLTPFVWSALFLSLGWNFLDFGLHPPDEAGPVVGWLICAVLFALMGGAPLAALFSPNFARRTLWADARDRPKVLAGRRRLVTPAALAAPREPDEPPPPLPPADDLATALRTMAELHDQGKLTDDEYTAAKRRLLED
jgi:hypothetical protein